MITVDPLMDSSGSAVRSRAIGRPVKVLMLATVDVGLAKLLKPLIDALLKSGYVVDAACANGPYAGALRVQGYRVYPVDFKRQILTFSHVTSFVQLLQLLRRERYDVLHVHTPIAQVLGRLAARMTRTPLVFYTSHGFQFHASRPLWLRKIALWLEWLLGRWATDVLFTQSLEDAKSAVALGIAPDKVQWIGNGVDLAVFRRGPRSVQLRQALSLDEDDRVVGFVGRIVREKGIIDLVDAMARVVQAIPAAKLLVVGDTLPSDNARSLWGDLRLTIRAHGLEGHVIFAGFRDDVPDLLALMDVFVLPSWREGMPRTVLEAMASGLPVVATDVRGCREEVVQGQTGLLVPPHDPLDLSRAIVQVLSDPVLARRMGEEGCRRAREFFDETVVIDKQLAVYEELLRRKAIRSTRASRLSVLAK